MNMNMNMNIKVNEKYMKKEMYKLKTRRNPMFLVPKRSPHRVEHFTSYPDEFRRSDFHISKREARENKKIKKIKTFGQIKIFLFLPYYIYIYIYI